MEKTELPTTTRLAELRQEGIVALSHYALRAAATLAVLLCMFGERESFLRVWSYYPNLLTSEQFFTDFKPLVADLLQIIYLPAVAAALAALALGLLQTQFLIKLDFVALQPNRCWIGLQFSPARLIFCLLSLVALAAAACLSFLLLSKEVWSLLYQPVSFLGHWSLSALTASLPVLSLFLVLSGLCAVIVKRLWFRFTHLMSRKEIESDGD